MSQSEDVRDKNEKLIQSKYRHLILYIVHIVLSCFLSGDAYHQHVCSCGHDLTEASCEHFVLVKKESRRTYFAILISNAS